MPLIRFTLAIITCLTMVTSSFANSNQTVAVRSYNHGIVGGTTGARQRQTSGIFAGGVASTIALRGYMKPGSSHRTASSVSAAAASVASRPAFVNNGMNECKVTDGLADIEDAATCEAAALQLGITWNPCCQNVASNPYGCIWRTTDNDIIFNAQKSTDGVLGFERFAICKRANYGPVEGPFNYTDAYAEQMEYDDVSTLAECASLCHADWPSGACYGFTFNVYHNRGESIPICRLFVMFTASVLKGFTNSATTLWDSKGNCGRLLKDEFVHMDEYTPLTTMSEYDCLQGDPWWKRWPGEVFVKSFWTGRDGLDTSQCTTTSIVSGEIFPGDDCDSGKGDCRRSFFSCDPPIMPNV